jgi:phosphate transport system substrate-binding protein
VKIKRHASVLGLLVAGALALTACGGDDSGDTGGGGGQQEQVSGAVVVDGSSTVAPLTSAAAELFQAEQSEVNVTVGTSGTGGGFKKFCAGETDIANASRQIKDDEAKACTDKGIQFSELQVANDALTVVVNRENTWVDCLTVEALKKMWEPNSQVKSWNQVDPSFPNEPLALYGPGTDSGTFDYFTGEIVGEEGSSRTDYTPSEDDNVTIQGVAGAKGALGYFGFSYFEENQDRLKAVKVDGGKGCVAPSVQAAQDGSYTPLARPLFIYPSDAGLKKQQVLAFVEFYLAHNKEVVEAARFVPLTEEQTKKAQDDFNTLKSKLGS